MLKVLMFSVFVVVIAEQSCPEVTENPTEDILIPHETDCSKFYKCSYGEKIEQDCYPGLYFNPDTLQCDWPENVDCENKP
ncbi:hypothetical protein FQA39_LY01489 [Lamprigera yunnana]|nr:hypothetical protein FQA39_LY01489 [Lamprigera yunnana]